MVSKSALTNLAFFRASSGINLSIGSKRGDYFMKDFSLLLE